MGKCESRDFDALFRQAKAETFELNVKERILLIIKEIITTLSDYFEFEPLILLKYIIADNEQLKNLLNLKSLSQAA
ncbi:hypothetical protein FACS189429_4940 [Bacteroidia bacterium]|nr:hypothetical protein FACS189429_4940 [Bacteroidia bacterium]